MKLIIDGSMRSIGITDVVYATARGLDPHADIPESLAEEIRRMGENVAAGKYDGIYTNDVTEGYRDLIKKAGRSVKKNPPTVPGFIDNIKHRGSMPHINSIVDVYNLESIRSSLAIGGKEKHVEPTDFVYRDDKGILAWLDVRDSEFYKMSDDTVNVLFVMQGNANTTVEYRVEAMKRLERDLRLVNPDMEFDIEVASI